MLFTVCDFIRNGKYSPLPCYILQITLVFSDSLWYSPTNCCQLLQIRLKILLNFLLNLLQFGGVRRITCFAIANELNVCLNCYYCWNCCICICICIWLRLLMSLHQANQVWLPKGMNFNCSGAARVLLYNSLRAKKDCKRLRIK